jgi:hypothetical protein
MNRLKILLLSSLFVTLSGCSLLDAYLMAGYDNQEYALINKIRTKAQLSVEDCSSIDTTKGNILQLKALGKEYQNFAQHIPRNEESYKMGVEMTKLIDQVKVDQGTSVVFCKMKFQQVERNAEKIQKVLGSKPR